VRAPRVRALLACVVTISTLAIGEVASLHLPKAVAVQTEARVRKVWSYAATVADLLHQTGISLRPRDRVIPAPSTRLASGMTIAIRRALPVRLVWNGRSQSFETAAVSVSEFLKEVGVQVRPLDRVLPASDTRLWPGATVRIVRIDTIITTEEERLPYTRVTQRDPNMPRGTTRLVQTGRAGARIRRIALTTADGLVIYRQIVRDVLIRSPQDQILKVGTKRIIASRGEFAGKEILLMEATAYAPWHGKGVNDITAIGLKAGFGVVAVDPSIIPLRTKLYIEGYGLAIAGDTGAAIKGHRIDLCFNTAQEAFRFGRRMVRVYVVAPAETASR
jgi:3D (Asp-Asp-Asp) domain-containing protein